MVVTKAIAKDEQKCLRRAKTDLKGAEQVRKGIVSVCANLLAVGRMPTEGAGLRASQANSLCPPTLSRIRFERTSRMPCPQFSILLEPVNRAMQLVEMQELVEPSNPTFGDFAGIIDI